MLSRASRLLANPRIGAKRVALASSSLTVPPTSAERGLSTSTWQPVDGAVANNLPSIHGRRHYQLQRSEFSTGARRRRRRGGGAAYETPQGDSDAASPDDKPASPPSGQLPSLSSEQFLSASSALLDKVEAAVTKLKDCNAGLEITRYPPSSIDHGASARTDEDDEEEEEPKYQRHGGQLSMQVESSEDLYWGGGTYWLTIHPDSGDVSLRSPLSGTFTYVYDAMHGEWVGNEDGHSLLGMLTRDWIRQCRGVPDF